MEKLFKVLFVGDSGTGAKTSLIYRIVEHTFIGESYATMGVDFKTIYLTNYLGDKLKLRIWDTAGQERFYKITESYYKGAHCILIGYDVTDKHSFDSIKNYHYNHTKELVGDIPLIYLVGNKIDLYDERVVSKEEGKSYAEERNIKFFEVSAKTGEGTNILIQDIVDSLTDRFKEEKDKNMKEIKMKNKSTIKNNKNKKEINKPNQLKIENNKNKIDENKTDKFIFENYKKNNFNTRLMKYFNL